MSVRQFAKQFPTDDACKAYLAEHRWADGIVRCPRCGFEATALTTKAFHWQCYHCAPESSYRFSVLVDTIFENTNKPLRAWFRVIHLMLTSKKGISALQIYRYMGFGSYSTAWSMCHRIRAGMADESFQQLMGIVEVDETYGGGKAKNKHQGKGGRGDVGGRGGIGNASIAGAVRRKGNVVARVIDDTDAGTLNAFVHETVSHKVSLVLVATDEHRGYNCLAHTFPHGVVCHSAGESVHGNIHTNTIEGFWSIIKRGIVGTFHRDCRHVP